jgi:hypothetical protein
LRTRTKRRRDTIGLARRRRPASSSTTTAGSTFTVLDRLRPALTESTRLGEDLAALDFWNRTLQNWQSEFLASLSMALLSIYLR